MGDLPRTPTGGLVDPMKTKLEMMVAYLAGRKGEAAESIRRELEDPTSEASRCLEAVRSRSRGIFGADLAGDAGSHPISLNPQPGDRTRDGRETAAFAALRRLVCCAGVHRGGYGVAGTG